MISHRASIENNNKVAPSNFLNQVFSTASVNNKDIKQVSDPSVVNDVQSMFNHAAPKVLKDRLQIDAKKYDLSMVDLKNIIGEVFGDSPIANVFDLALNTLEDTGLFLNNIVNRTLILLKPFVDSLCFIMRLLDGLLALTIPFIKLLLGILTLLRLSYENCQANLFQKAMDSIDSDLLRELVSIHATEDAVHNNNDQLLGDILNSTHTKGLAERYPYLANLVTAEYQNGADKQKETRDNRTRGNATKHEVFIDQAENKRKRPKRYVYKTNPPSQAFLNILYGLNRVDTKLIRKEGTQHQLSTEQYSDTFVSNLLNSVGHDIVPTADQVPILDKTSIFAIHGTFSAKDPMSPTNLVESDKLKPYQPRLRF